MSVQVPTAQIVDRLAQLRTLSRAPRAELEWLAARGTVRRYQPGDYIARKGTSPEQFGLAILLAGQFSIVIDRGAGPHRVMQWQTGDIYGVLPFSRMTAVPGDTLVEIAAEAFSVPTSYVEELKRECPVFTEICVHAMLDRARVFNSSDWQNEKMVALGKLAAGLAHELNNPASAVARTAKTLPASITDAERAARALGLARLTDAQLDAVDRLREEFALSLSTSLSPIELADREDEIAEWLLEHGADASATTALAESAITIARMNDLADLIPEDALDPALDWVAADWSLRRLALEIEKAATRIHELVDAVKRFSRVDRAQVPEPVDLERGLRDTIMILASKARSKSITVSLDIPPDLPRVRAMVGDLNQVWSNLLDNALDAAPEQGQVSVNARLRGRNLIVTFVDDGPGVPDAIKNRIFDAFFTTKEPGKGTGLGLDITRRLMRANGGDIELESRPGHTEFRVSLPIEEG